MFSPCYTSFLSCDVCFHWISEAELLVHSNYDTRSVSLSKFLSIYIIHLWTWIISALFTHRKLQILIHSNNVGGFRISRAIQFGGRIAIHFDYRGFCNDLCQRLHQHQIMRRWNFVDGFTVECENWPGMVDKKGILSIYWDASSLL